jgi:hypothetical protein
VAREKTRQHIAHLEGLVKTLQDTESSSDRIQKLLDQLSSSQDEIGRLRDTLSRINRISQDNSQIYQRRPDPFRPYNDERSKKGDEASLCSTIGMPTGQDIPFVETDPACTLSDLENLLSIPPESASATSQEPFPLEALNLDAHPIDLDSLTLIREDSDPESCQSASKISPIPAGLCLDHLQHQNDSFNQLIQRDCDHEQQGTGPNDDSVLQVASFLMSIKDLEGRLWWLASRVLNHILSLKDVIFTPRVLDDDIAIRSCIDGWSAVEHMYKLDVGWKWLRVLDENMYSQLKITTRMAILRAMRTQYLVSLLKTVCPVLHW